MILLKLQKKEKLLNEASIDLSVNFLADEWSNILGSNVTDSDIKHFIYGMASFIPYAGAGAAAADAALYLEEGEKSGDWQDYLFAGLALLGVIPGMGIVAKGVGKVSANALRAALTGARGQKALTQVSKGLNLIKPGAGLKFAESLQTFYTTGGDIAIKGVSTAAKAKSVTNIDNAVEAVRSGRRLARTPQAAMVRSRAVAAGKAAEKKAAEAGKSVVDILKAGSKAREKAINKFVEAARKAQKTIGKKQAKLANRLKKTPNPGFEAAHRLRVAELEKDLVKGMMRAGYTVSDINQALKVAGSSTKLRGMTKTIKSLKMTNPETVKFLDDLQSLQGFRAAAQNLPYKLGKLAGGAATLRIVTPTISAVFSDGKESTFTRQDPFSGGEVTETNPSPKKEEERVIKALGGRCKGFFTKGCKGELVKMIQRNLVVAGFSPEYKDPVDGDYGSATKTAVIKFQKEAVKLSLLKEKLPSGKKSVDGMYGAYTHDAMGAYLKTKGLKAEDPFTKLSKKMSPTKRKTKNVDIPASPAKEPEVKTGPFGDVVAKESINNILTNRLYLLNEKVNNKLIK